MRLKILGVGIITMIVGFAFFFTAYPKISFYGLEVTRWLLPDTYNVFIVGLVTIIAGAIVAITGLIKR